jgi:diaminopimelate epimerase
MSDLNFIKMHGLGNDFVVLDARLAPLVIDDASVRAISERRTGIGCDQLLVLEKPRNPNADAFLAIRNANGETVSACGNGTRCAAALLIEESGRDRVTIETLAGVLTAEIASDGLVTVDMGPAREDWRDIPLSEACDTLHIDIKEGPLCDPVGVNVGNPHAVYFVDDVETVPMATLGPRLEHHPLFPERTNVEAVQVLSRDRLRMRVWERGVGITQACGTGACAALVAAARRGLTGREADVELDGGTLRIVWRDDGHVLMTGPVAVSFRGVLDRALLS